MAKTDGDEPRSRRTLIVVLAVVVLAIAGVIVTVAVVRHHRTMPRLQVIGTVIVLDGSASGVNITNGASNCTGAGQFSDIARGTPVRMIDSSDSVTGPVRLGYGQQTPDRRACVFYFPIEPPGGQKYYDVKVGTRPVVRKTQNDLHDLKLVYGS